MRKRRRNPTQTGGLADGIVLSFGKRADSPRLPRYWESLQIRPSARAAPERQRQSFKDLGLCDDETILGGNVGRFAYRLE